MIGELSNHLWQSTIFAIAIALLTLVFRGNRAQVRYWLWLSASVKFLLPFSLLIAIGNGLPWGSSVQSPLSAPAVRITVMQVSQPFSKTLLHSVSAPPVRDWTTVVILFVWACGSAVLTIVRLRDWRRIRATLRSSALIDVLETMQVRSSPGLLEPGVVGLFRPVLLLPNGIADRLPAAQLKAVLAHEMTHSRRRDNLTSAIHMMVETLFWFHPLVWWIGARLLAERERACDEAVLRMGSEPNDYAAGILNVCRSYLESPLTCVPGVTGSDLKKRIHAILTGCVTRKLSFVRKLTLTCAGIAALTLPIALGVIKGLPVETQLPATTRFEVASIRPCAEFRKTTIASPERFSSGCTTVLRLAQQAYGLFANGRLNIGSSVTVTGGPAWIRSDLYQINAKAESPQTRAVMNGPMLQALLEDRFKLQVHPETRGVPVYALTEARSGARLQPFQPGSCTPFNADHPPRVEGLVCGISQVTAKGFDAAGVTMADFAASFSAILDRPVIDETGIPGKFTIHLPVSPHELGVDRPRSLPALGDPGASSTPPDSTDGDAADVFVAVQSAVKRLGLNLEPAKGPGEFLVVDHVERPSPN